MMIKIRSLHHRQIHVLEVQKESCRGMRGGSIILNGSLFAFPNKVTQLLCTNLFQLTLLSLGNVLPRNHFFFLRSAEYFWERQPRRNLLHHTPALSGVIGCPSCAVLTPTVPPEEVFHSFVHHFVEDPALWDQATKKKRCCHFQSQLLGESL